NHDSAGYADSDCICSHFVRSVKRGARFAHCVSHCGTPSSLCVLLDPQCTTAFMTSFTSQALKAILGPTNTGKTHYAIERMLAYRSGMIGLPLRLLAREVYNRVVAQAGEASVALVTGEERIVPKNARYWIATVEAMPTD